MEEETTLLLRSAPADGAWNMAVDDWLLRRASEKRVSILRWYAWSEATVSLGYFQRRTDMQPEGASATLPAVRRTTGGGAIVHDRELTYSFTLPASHRFYRARAELYGLFHRELLAALAVFGVQADLYGKPPEKVVAATTESRHTEPFLCFERRTDGDVVLCGSAIRPKIAGSAQYRNKNGMLQHGSVLLACSPSTPHVPGIAECTGRLLDPAKLIAVWQDRLEKSLGFRCQPFELFPEAIPEIETIAAARYRNAEWSWKR